MSNVIMKEFAGALMHNAIPASYEQLNDFQKAQLALKSIDPRQVHGVHKSLVTPEDEDLEVISVGGRYVSIYKTVEIAEKACATGGKKMKKEDSEGGQVSSNKGKYKSMVQCPDCGSHFEVEY